MPTNDRHFSLHNKRIYRHNCYCTRWREHKEVFTFWIVRNILDYYNVHLKWVYYYRHAVYWKHKGLRSFHSVKTHTIIEGSIDQWYPTMEFHIVHHQYNTSMKRCEKVAITSPLYGLYHQARPYHAKVLCRCCTFDWQRATWISGFWSDFKGYSDARRGKVNISCVSSIGNITNTSDRVWISWFVSICFNVKLNLWALTPRFCAAHEYGQDTDQLQRVLDPSSRGISGVWIPVFNFRLYRSETALVLIIENITSSSCSQVHQELHQVRYESIFCTRRWSLV